MGDPYKKVQPGQKLVIPAGAYNAFVDAARATRAGQHDVAGAAKALVRQTGIVKVRNSSGADLDRFAVLGIDAPIIAPSANLDEFKRQVALKGVVPTTDHAGKFVVLLEPLKDGAIGMAAAAGVTICRVNVDKETDPAADAADGITANLVSAPFGSARILWKESGTGSIWAVVRLGDALDMRPKFMLGNLAAALVTTDLTASVTTLSVLSPAGAIVPEEPLVVDNTFKWEADEGAVCLLIYDEPNDKWLLFQVLCPAEEE